MLGLLLAAGRGGRFDLQSEQSKLLQSLENGTSFESSLSALQAATTRSYCVLPALESRWAGHANPVHIAQLARTAIAHGVKVFFAPHARLGMGESLAWACAHIARLERTPQTLLVHLADMPWVSSASMIDIGAACDQRDAIAAPIYANQRGNPVAFGSAIWPQMLALQGDQGARKWLTIAHQEGRLRLVNCKDNAVLRDIDTPADLPSQYGHPTTSS